MFAKLQPIERHIRDVQLKPFGMMHDSCCADEKGQYADDMRLEERHIIIGVHARLSMF
jgi:hypothetical protein